MSAGSQIGCTASTDYACQCSSATALQSATQNCVLSACGVASALAVVTSASAVCACIATASPSPVAAPVTISSEDAIPTPPSPTTTLTVLAPTAPNNNPVLQVPPKPTGRPSLGFGLFPPRPNGTHTRKPLIIGTGGIPACQGTGFLTLPSIAIPSQLIPPLPTGFLPPTPGVPTPQAPGGGPAAPTTPATLCKFSCRELKGIGCKFEIILLLGRNADRDCSYQLRDEEGVE